MRGHGGPEEALSQSGADGLEDRGEVQGSVAGDRGSLCQGEAGDLAGSGIGVGRDGLGRLGGHSGNSGDTGSFGDTGNWGDTINLGETGNSRDTGNSGLGRIKGDERNGNYLPKILH